MKRTRTIFRAVIALAAVGIALAGCASSPDRSQPEVGLTEKSPVHISPASSPGSQDTYSSGVVAEAVNDSVLVGYEVVVETQDGAPVFTFGTDIDQERLEETDKESVVPDRIFWNGRDNQNRFVGDGTYLLTLSVTDEEGRTTASQPVSIVVNNTPPDAEVDMPHNTFSPGAGDERNTVSIRHHGSGATEWTGRIVDDDDVTIRLWSWGTDLPETHEWDGTDDSDSVVDDGRYRYVLRGTDEAGNSVSATLRNIIVDTRTRDLELDRNRPAFSPDDDGVRDSVTFTPKVADSVESLEWEFTITNESDETVMERTGSDEVPGSFEFTGIRDDETLPEGDYTPKLAVTFRNGRTGTVEGRSVKLDVTPPSVEAEAEADEFSPEGGSEYQTISFSQESDDAVVWKGKIVDADDDDTILEKTWEDDLSETFTWNGQTGRGDEAATGEYRYVLTATDRGGNEEVHETSAFLLDRSAPEVDVSVSPTPFFPAADDESEDAAEPLAISIETEDLTEIADITVTIYDPEENEFATIDDVDTDDETIHWNGRGDDGELPESARDYTVAVTVADDVGNESTVEETVPIGIIVTEDQEGDLRFRITGIHFPPFEADYTNVDDREMLEENRETIDRIAELLDEYPDQTVQIEGHAVHIYHDDDDEERHRREQEEVLLPLSEARAEAIRDALVDRGIDEDRLEAVGRGGDEPLVPHDDRENRWKNRRVEFELVG
ncbi:MAG: OmpA family protein [Alkalispirochaeta sp.]